MPSITRDSVAEKAGVSTATVSRVMNGNTTVQPSLRERVLAAANELGYQPNRTATALRRRSTGLVLLVYQTSSPHERELETYNTQFVQALLGVQDALHTSHLTVGLAAVASVDDVMSLPVDHPCDGLVGYNLERPDILQSLERLGMPYVVGARMPLKSTIPHTWRDSYRGGELAAEGILRDNRKRPMLLSVRGSARTFYDYRSGGFRERLLREGIQCREVCCNNVGIHHGYEAGVSVVEDIRRGDIDAVFGISSWAAVGFVQALYARGIDIGKDISVVGYDRMSAYNALPVTISMIDANVRHAFRSAGEQLKSQLTREECLWAQRIEPEYVPAR